MHGEPGGLVERLWCPCAGVARNVGRACLSRVVPTPGRKLTGAIGALRHPLYSSLRLDAAPSAVTPRLCTRRGCDGKHREHTVHADVAFGRE